MKILTFKCKLVQNVSYVNTNNKTHHKRYVNNYISYILITKLYNNYAIIIIIIIIKTGTKFNFNLKKKKSLWTTRTLVLLFCRRKVKKKGKIVEKRKRLVKEGGGGGHKNVATSRLHSKFVIGKLPSFFLLRNSPIFSYFYSPATDFPTAKWLVIKNSKI